MTDTIQDPAAQARALADEWEVRVPADSIWAANAPVAETLRAAAAEIERQRSAVVEHRGQKADDRCIEDDDRLYAVFGLPPCDRRVGNKAEMLANCARFIDRRCEGGGWPTYRELETELASLRVERDAAQCDFRRCRNECDQLQHKIDLAKDAEDDVARAADEAVRNWLGAQADIAMLAAEVKYLRAELAGIRAMTGVVVHISAEECEAAKCDCRVLTAKECVTELVTRFRAESPAEAAAERKGGKALKGGKQL